MKIKINNLEETKQFATALAKHIDGQFLLLLEGDLGAGKTTFTKMLGKALGESKTINSPTFTILKQYEKLNHIDAYRLEGIEQDLGFEEVFEEDKLCVIEWFYFIKQHLPNQYLHIKISVLEEETRLIELFAKGEKYEKILEEFA